MASRGGGAFSEKEFAVVKKTDNSLPSSANFSSCNYRTISPPPQVIMEWNLINNKYNFVFLTLWNRNNEWIYF